MGGATKLKNQKKEQEEFAFRESFSQNNFRLKLKAQQVEPPITEKLKEYAHLAIRPLEQFSLKTKSKHKDKQLVEAVRFAFGKYSVGQALTNVWHESRRPSIVKADLKLWYICVATGGSLYKEHAKDFLSKKEVHCLVNCSHDLHPNQALCYAVAKAVAPKDEGSCLRLAKSKFQEKTLNEFWKSCLRFFAVNPPKSIDQVNDLVDYLSHRYQANNGFSIAGHSLAALLKRMDDWHRDLQRAKALGDARWAGFDMPDEVFDAKDELGNAIQWQFHQILTTKELAAEGNRMRHCVFSYKQGCISGYHSIWSLSKSDFYNGTIPKITIELRKGGYIAQARGLANRAPRPEEKHIIRLWAQKHNLEFGYGY